jgi:hypothetical protein
MASRRMPQPGHRHSGEMVREVVSAAVPAQRPVTCVGPGVQAQPFGLTLSRFHIL